MPPTRKTRNTRRVPSPSYVFSLLGASTMLPNIVASERNSSDGEEPFEEPWSDSGGEGKGKAKE